MKDKPTETEEITEDQTTINTFLNLLYRRLENLPSVNPHYDLSKSTNTKISHYQKLFTHYFTLLNYRNRKQQNGMYITQKEDIEASLKLLSIIKLPRNIYIKNTRGRYKYLQKITGGRPVSRKEVEELLSLSKTTTNTYLNQWLKQKKITLSGKKNKGYLYSFPPLIEEGLLKTLTLEDEAEPSMFDQAMEEYEDFQGWENLKERT